MTRVRNEDFFKVIHLSVHRIWHSEYGLVRRLLKTQGFSRVSWSMQDGATDERSFMLIRMLNAAIRRKEKIWTMTTCQRKSLCFHESINKKATSLNLSLCVFHDWILQRCCKFSSIKWLSFVKALILHYWIAGFTAEEKLFAHLFPTKL